MESGRRKILTVAVMFAMGLFVLSGVERLWQGSMGSARLVSIEELPEVGDACERPVKADSRLAAAADQNLFSDFDERSVHAQDSGGTVDVTRPAVRKILDTAPIYSS